MSVSLSPTIDKFSSLALRALKALKARPWPTTPMNLRDVQARDGRDETNIVSSLVLQTCGASIEPLMGIAMDHDIEQPPICLLPPDLLRVVLAEVPESERRCIVPLISKVFAAAVRDPTLWPTVHVHDEAKGRGLNSRLIRAWLSARAGSINSLQLRLRSTANGTSAGGAADLLQQFATYTRLQHLSLCVSGKLQPRDYSIITSLTSLTTLDLKVGVRTGAACSVLSSLGALRKLRCLSVYMKLSGYAGGRPFPEGLLQLTALRSLMLRTTPNIDLGSLPDKITALQHLEDLELRDCFVLPDVSIDRKCLPIGFGGLPLTRLVLAPFAFNSDARQANSLAELRGLTGLRELTLESCQVNDRLSESPAADSLSCLKALTSISLRQSPSIARQLPASMDWSCMLSADLSQCSLPSVGAAVMHAPNLRQLDLTLNDCEQISTSVEWPQLEKLLLSHNRFESLPEVEAPSLRELHMSYNGPLLQLRHRDVDMLTQRWPQLRLMDLDRGKTVDLEQGGKRLPPPRWTFQSLMCAFEALTQVEPTREVKLVLHRGPVSGHEVVLTVANVRDGDRVLSPCEAFARRFPQ